MKGESIYCKEGQLHFGKVGDQRIQIMGETLIEIFQTVLVGIEKWE